MCEKVTRKGDGEIKWTRVNVTHLVDTALTRVLNEPRVGRPLRVFPVVRLRVSCVSSPQLRHPVPTHRPNLGTPVRTRRTFLPSSKSLPLSRVGDPSSRSRVDLPDDTDLLVLVQSHLPHTPHTPSFVLSSCPCARSSLFRRCEVWVGWECGGRSRPRQRGQIDVCVSPSPFHWVDGFQWSVSVVSVLNLGTNKLRFRSIFTVHTCREKEEKRGRCHPKKPREEGSRDVTTTGVSTLEEVDGCRVWAWEGACPGRWRVLSHIPSQGTSSDETHCGSSEVGGSTPR